MGKITDNERDKFRPVSTEGLDVEPDWDGLQGLHGALVEVGAELSIEWLAGCTDWDGIRQRLNVGNRILVKLVTVYGAIMPGLKGLHLTSLRP
jgi:hypothetical protein